MIRPSIKSRRVNHLQGQLSMHSPFFKRFVHPFEKDDSHLKKGVNRVNHLSKGESHNSLGMTLEIEMSLKLPKKLTLARGLGMSN